MKYSDSDGKIGFASPDLVLPDARIIIECKRTYTLEADAQLLLVYAPLLDWIWPGGGWRLVSACKNWAGPEKPLISSPLEAKPGLNHYLHRP